MTDSRSVSVETLKEALRHEAKTTQYGDTGQAGTTIERIFQNYGDAVGDCNVGQAAARTERRVTVARDPVWDDDAGQIGAIERFESDVGDWRTHAIHEECAGDADCATRPCIEADIDRTIVVDRSQRGA